MTLSSNRATGSYSGSRSWPYGHLSMPWMHFTVGASHSREKECSIRQFSPLILAAIVALLQDFSSKSQRNITYPLLGRFCHGEITPLSRSSGGLSSISSQEHQS
ncbi:hypothetical protein OE88DRAFT_509915 [Heliocybe sulcata]|uniref:Uncharacterized protein n=1 Tax=Heliocybe sulcata TaxID=5364 RepID=A0A5C3N4Y0_9AGAM|nr:hypothetical protein OE88DRAFT_509915 [Heliocybe sulcata]